MPIIQMLYAM